VGSSLRSPSHHSKGVTPLTAALLALVQNQTPMEWMLQVVDEIDDAIGALRLCVVGLAAEIGLVAAGALGMGAIGAAIAAGAEVPLICCAAIVLSLAASLKIHALAAVQPR
jgi:hypothetical protein